MSDKKEYLVLNKELLDECLKTLGSLLRKRNKNGKCEIIIVGGASIVLNYNFRLTTMDIDCMDENKILMNDIVNAIADKYNLPSSWINTDFMNTKSYSPKIKQYSSFYKSFSNGALEVRTVKDEYLLAMKVASGRKYKNDYSDIYGIIMSCLENGKAITETMLETAIIDLYNSFDCIDKESFEFAKLIINNPNALPYDEIRKEESKNASLLKSRKLDKMEQADIDYILSKLDIK